MRALSKSKLLAFRQCPKRLWLEVHHPELRQDSAATQASFQMGHAVGEVARRLYDESGQGVLINAQREGFDAALARSKELLKGDRPIFEAGFRAAGALAFADVMLPATQSGQSGWRMVEVKSSTGVKDYHLEDAAIQAFVAREAGVPLLSLALAHVDSNWVYPGGDDYRGLLVERDVTEQAFARKAEVIGWIAGAQKVAAGPSEPEIATGPHCATPFKCGFLAHCTGQETSAEYPVQWLPNVRTNALKAFLAQDGIKDLSQVPDELLNQIQLRVKQHTLAGTMQLDLAGTAEALRPYGLPAFFIDFETVQFAVPIWAGMHPYDQIPFQFSVHRITTGGALEDAKFIDLSGADPSQRFADALIRECGDHGPVFVYNAGFEKPRLNELAQRFPALRDALQSIASRIVDLLPIAQAHTYHPSQQGSWSIKKVLPALAPDLSYDSLDGIQDGGMAPAAYMEAIQPQTAPERRAQIEQQLLAYCGLDTYAMVRLWQIFASRSDLNL